MTFEKPHHISLLHGSVAYMLNSGPDKGIITKGVFLLEESLESLKSLDFLESLENGWILLCFPESAGSPESLDL